MEILYKSKNIIVVYKPAGMPSERDISLDSDAMTEAIKMLEESGENSTLWLVHRLDRVVGGLLVFARNKHSAAKLSALISEKSVQKEYFAVVEGECFGGTLKNYIYKPPHTSKAYITDTLRKGVKEAELEYVPIESMETDKGIFTLVKISLKTGRYHQIRAQFSHQGLPIVGDGKYGSHNNRAKMPALFSCRLAFSLNSEKVDMKKTPPKEYPWDLFDESKYL